MKTTKTLALAPLVASAGLAVACTAGSVEDEEVDFDIVSAGGKFDELNGQALRLTHPSGTPIPNGPFARDELEVDFPFRSSMALWDLDDRLVVNAHTASLELAYDIETGARGYRTDDGRITSPAPDAVYRVGIQSIDEHTNAQVGFVMVNAMSRVGDMHSHWANARPLTCESAAVSQNVFSSVVIDAAQQTLSFDGETVGFSDCGWDPIGIDGWDLHGIIFYPVPLTGAASLPEQIEYEVDVEVLGGGA